MICGSHCRHVLSYRALIMFSIVAIVVVSDVVLIQPRQADSRTACRRSACTHSATICWPSGLIVGHTITMTCSSIALISIVGATRGRMRAAACAAVPRRVAEAAVDSTNALPSARGLRASASVRLGMASRRAISRCDRSSTDSASDSSEIARPARLAGFDQFHVLGGGRELLSH